MVPLGRILSRLVATVVSILVMVLVAVLTFFLTVFVVSTGAGLAGYDPDGNFVVLAASLLVVAAIVAGAFPRSLGREEEQYRAQEGEDPTYH